MNELEFSDLQNRLKDVYNFKFDVEVLKDSVINYKFEDCIKAYKNIVGTLAKLTGVNIIYELKSELFTVKPEIAYKQFLNCEDCQNSGLITMRDEQKRRFAFACKCQKGQDKQKTLKLNQWCGSRYQTIKNMQYVLEG